MARSRQRRRVGPDGKAVAPLADEVFTDEEIEQYLDAIRQGIGADLAARGIGATGTKMRSLRRRDPVFSARFDEAYVEGQEHYRDRLRGQVRLRALAAENPSDRMLEVELATHVPGYEHLRRDRMKVDGRIDHGLILALDPSALDALPVEKLKQLRALLEEAGGGIFDPAAPPVRPEIDDQR